LGPGTKAGGGGGGGTGGVREYSFCFAGGDL